jgi:hypothetical protein
MGAIGNLAAAGAIQSGRYGKKHQQQAAADAAVTGALLATIASELAEANRHAVALVNEQMRTNQLLTALLESRPSGNS